MRWRRSGCSVEDGPPLEALGTAVETQGKAVKADDKCSRTSPQFPYPSPSAKICQSDPTGRDVSFRNAKPERTGIRGDAGHSVGS